MPGATSANPLPMQLPNTSQPIAMINAPAQGLLDSQGKPVTGQLNLSAFVTQSWRYYFASLIQSVQSAAQSATQWIANGNNIYNANSGSVGINTKTPAALLDIEGANAKYFNTSNGSKSPLALQIATGADAAPITTPLPSVAISRNEALALGTDTEGGQNAALYVESFGTNASTVPENGGTIAQVNALVAVATQQGTGDVVGVFGAAIQESPNYHSYAGFFTAAAINTGGSAIALGTAVAPPAGAAYSLAYSQGHGGTGTFGIDLAGIGTGLNTAAVLIRNAGTNWDVGVYWQNPASSYYLYSSIFNVDTAGHFNTTSDRNVKEAISVIPDGALDRIMHLVPSTFTYIADPRKRVYAGLIAQDVRDVMPEAVSVNADNHLMTNDASIIAHLIKAVQELEHEVRVLRASRA